MNNTGRADKLAVSAVPRGLGTRVLGSRSGAALAGGQESHSQRLERSKKAQSLKVKQEATLSSAARGQSAEPPPCPAPGLDHGKTMLAYPSPF